MSGLYKQQNSSAYVKYFNNSINVSPNTWTHTTYNNSEVLTPISKTASVYIPNNLYVGGSFINPSDIQLKENIEVLDNTFVSKNIDQLLPKKYTFISDTSKKVHYGFIAQEMEELFPDLVNEIDVKVENENENETGATETGATETETIKTIKTINYLELIPLLLSKVQDLQKQVDELKKIK